MFTVFEILLEKSLDELTHVYKESNEVPNAINKLNIKLPTKKKFFLVPGG